MKASPLFAEAMRGASFLIVDKGYDANAFQNALRADGATPAIPDRSNRKREIVYDKIRYRDRHRIENEFCQERRDEVVRYVRDRYGADKVAQIVALGSLQARAAVRDVGRVLQVPLSVVDRMAKLIPNPPGHPVTLREAMESEPRLQQLLEQEPDAGKIFTIAEQIEGFYRHTTTHPAGVVIGDRPLNEIVPLYRDPRADMPVTQFDCEDAEKAGLVKFDFLGLKTLTVISKAEALLKRRGIDVHTQSIDFDDTQTFEMLARGESVGVFQLEGQGMRDLLRKMRPDHINDLVALVALYRPGPMDSIPKYIAVKNGKEAPEYLHPSLEPILKETYGVMTYQEDVMNIARELAGYSLGEADLLRRAMGKKIVSEMARHRDRFVKGAGEKGILPSIANQIFEQAAKFAGYGFNKGHAAAYAQVAYQTAYLKANYPVEFLAASMTLDVTNTDRLNIFKQEALRLGITLAPPDVNWSDAVFNCDAGKNIIFYALAAVKGVGVQAMEHLVEVRTQDGPFRSIADFARRVDSRLVNRRAFESLARAGAFDSLSPNRRQLVESADMILSDSARRTRDRESGQVSLFGETSSAADTMKLADVQEWTAHERLGEEFSAVGFYLSAHPLDNYKTSLTRLQAQPYAQIMEDRRSSFQTLLAGTVLKKSERRSRNGDSYAFVSLSDTSGMFEVMFFPEVLAASRPMLEAGKAVLLKATATWEGEEIKLRALSVTDLEKAAADAGEGLRIFLQDPEALNGLASLLREPGKGVVTIVVPTHSGQEVEIKLAKRHSVTPTLCSAIKSLRGVAAVETI